MKIITIAEVAKLTAAATLKQLVEQLGAEQRAFVAVAKLARHLESTLDESQTLGSVLRDKGIRKSTIDNARYAMRVIDELVVPGHLPEKTFDTLSFRDCFRITNAMSARSAMQLEPADVAVVIKKAPKSWDDELDCLFEHGMTVEQKTASDLAAKASSPAPAEHDTPSENPAPAENTAPTVNPTPTANSAPTPDNIVQMPPSAATAPTAEAATSEIDHIEAILCELDDTELSKLKDRLLAFAETITALFAAKETSSKKARKAA